MAKNMRRKKEDKMTKTTREGKKIKLQKQWEEKKGQEDKSHERKVDVKKKRRGKWRVMKGNVEKIGRKE